MKRLTSALATLGLLAGLTALTGLAAGPATARPAVAVAATTASVPQPDHVVVVIFENTAEGSIIGNSNAPYFNQLASSGALFTNAFAIEHPSEPNYLDLFSGSNQGVTDDSCPHTFSTANEGAQLIAKGLTFTGYSENLPSAGSTVCTAGTSGYARKHNPWVNFSNVPAADNQPFSAFPTDFTKLPTVSWVVPNLCNDMHDCSTATGDTWLKAHLDSYVQWAKAHNSVLITTFDEDDSAGNNQIATIFDGQPVKTGTYSEHVDHFGVLRTIEDMYGLPYAGAAASATSITDAWNTGTTGSVTVTNPGSQTGTVGTAASLQVNATDTATGTLSYSATGLPAGLSINSATGLVSGTPTTAGTSSVTVTATDSTGVFGSASFGWTVNPVASNVVTVTNPGSQTGTVGTASSLQVNATDSASGQTLTYAASGLPAGLSVNSATGLISGTPTTAGTFSVTVTATDSTGAFGSASFGWTVNPASTGCTAAQLLGNPGFETGSASPWTASSGVIDNSGSEPAHAGSWKAWLDGYGSAHTDTLAQTVTIPAGCANAAFTYWLHIDTAETGTTAYDTLKLQAINGGTTTTLSTYSNVNAGAGYTQRSVNLAQFVGKTITLKFTGAEDSSSQTSFVIDDTALNVS
ncbi:putative Ig domain-containing protein [Kitasatospora nipponensis]|uniref:putative Ig domain-containing protein n=1 Tax=Kitasatospora nipponensis TaxID=258049 RepID=UPI0031D45535